MNQEQITKLELSVENMKNKKSRIYLIAQDTKGNAKASIAYIYRLGLSLLKSFVVVIQRPGVYRYNVIKKTSNSCKN